MRNHQKIPESSPLHSSVHPIYESQCNDCVKTQNGSFAHFQNSELDLVLYRLQSFLPYIQRQLRYFDDEVSVLTDILAKRKKEELSRESRLKGDSEENK